MASRQGFGRALWADTQRWMVEASSDDTLSQLNRKNQIQMHQVAPHWSCWEAVWLGSWQISESVASGILETYFSWSSNKVPLKSPKQNCYEHQEKLFMTPISVKLGWCCITAMKIVVIINMLFATFTSNIPQVLFHKTMAFVVKLYNFCLMPYYGFYPQELLLCSWLQIHFCLTKLLAVI